MGRPATRPADLKDGFYIEVDTNSSGSMVKIRRSSKEEIDQLIERYGRNKKVNYLGEVKNGKWVGQKKR